MSDLAQIREHLGNILGTAALEEFDVALAERERQVAEKTWDECMGVVKLDAGRGFPIINPYRNPTTTDKEPS